MLFRTVDDKLRDLGFIKETEDEHGAVYVRTDNGLGFQQMVSLLRKASGKHILQSYDRYLFDCEGVGNTCVGLTYKELRLFTKKMKQLGLE